ncbi:hypothetical protein DICPUDRAFT_158742 [Dictyostelium purpureum]|uniref:Tim44-like domain-containing protein n=1 Tax=Dictyostelium purpureum TaxID=5786 RepID=F1A2C8_DICPU|nr:uncharacterized protein DICPUDRAFT_158742 [Dictyostelium purpureum]EGC29654.1 hypothetical protein DICPUDRAFT_158742 [Dictyostelium purpureum]|eukprot:XP_003293823.1 hypothetical protein DICPUDRAFT_158742 [Dictyostelium purpureum]
MNCLNNNNRRLLGVVLKQQNNFINLNRKYFGNISNIASTTRLNNENKINYQTRTAFNTPRRMKQNYFLQSTGAIFNEEVQPSLTSIITTPNKWYPYGKFIYQNITSHFVIKSKLKALDRTRYTKRAFLKEAEDMFIKVNESIADGNKHQLNELSSIQFGEVVEKKSGYLNRNKDLKFKWSCNITGKNLLWTRAGQIKTSAKSSTFFAQNCVEFIGTQSIQVFDKKNNLISENKDQPFKLEYIFERNLASTPSMWRVCSSTDYNIGEKI